MQALPLGRATSAHPAGTRMRRGKPSAPSVPQANTGERLMRLRVAGSALVARQVWMELPSVQIVHRARTLPPVPRHASIVPRVELTTTRTRQLNAQLAPLGSLLRQDRPSAQIAHLADTKKLLGHRRPTASLVLLGRLRCLPNVSNAMLGIQTPTLTPPHRATQLSVQVANSQVSAPPSALPARLGLLILMVIRQRRATYAKQGHMLPYRR